METLTDFATVQYFGVDTVTVGIFRIWRGSYDRDAAAEIAALVLGFAVVVIVAERILRGRARFGAVGGRSRTFTRHRLTGWKGVAALAASGSVVAIAFVLPVAQLTAWAIAEQRGPRGTPQLEKFTELLGNSLTLTAITTGLCLLVGLVVTNADRFAPSRFGDATRRITTFGYAVPGPVVAMGMVLGLVALDDALERIGGDLPGTIATGSLLGLVLAYMVRFFAPAVNATESGLEQVSDDLTAAARTLGHRPISILGRVHLPLTWASVVAAAVLVGVDALKELPVALLLRPIGFDTLPIWVFGLATESRFQQAALPALSIIAVATLPVIIIARHLDTPRR
jgi:iron(III) transport system permease protein